MRLLFASVLLVLLSVLIIEAQKPIASPTPPIESEDDGFVCGLRVVDLVQINVSVRSSKKGYLKNLTYKDFEVYDEKIFQEVEFFKFNELTNQYTIGFHPKVFKSSDDKWHDVKIKVKLSEEKKKAYGKIFVSGQNGYYPNPN